jgi:hypothetical protein
MKISIALIVAVVLVGGCAGAPKIERSPVSARDTAAAPTTQPILYQRTGGIAGTDDRVVIWPDGAVLVEGKIIPSTTTRIDRERLNRLLAMMDGWSKLDDHYLAANIPDAYLITIHYGGKSVEASDLAPNLPEQFRQVFTEIEAIATLPSMNDRNVTP